MENFSIDLLFNLGFISKLIIVFIISGFFPFTAFSFIRIMVPRKEKEFNKALDEMGISSTRSVKDSYAPGRYFLPVSFAFLICLLSISYIMFAGNFTNEFKDSLLLTGAFFGDENKALIFQSLSVLTYAFLGGFIWSAQNIIRRLIANDLAPNVYYSAGIRLVLASIIALVMSFLIGAEAQTNFLNFKASLTAIAMLVGMFPERFLSYLINLFKTYINPDTLNTDLLSLYKIEGISLQHKERLNEIGIDNAQNLATASLTQLLIDTPFEARQILDWIGQAKLLCYVKDDIDKLRSVGIRTVFDLFKGNKRPNALQEISDAVGINSPLLHVIHEQVLADPGINALYRFQGGVNKPTNSDVIDDIPEANEPISERIG